MKVIIYILLYMFLTLIYYLLLSLFGLFFYDYKSIVSNPEWFICYMIVFHFPLVALSLDEYYKKHLKK